MDIILKRRITLIFTGIIISIAFLFCTANYPLICFAAVSSLLILLISLYFKEKVFFAFVFLYPLIPRYFAFDLGGAMPLITVGRLLIIYVFIFDLVFNRDKFRKTKKILFSKDLKIALYSIAFLVFTFMLNYFTYPNVESFKIFISFLLENVLVGVYFFLRAGSCKDVEKAVKCLLFASFIIAMTGIIEFTLRVNVFSFLDIVKTNRQLLSSDVYSRLGENRIEGPFGHPLAYCNFLLMVIPMGIYEWQISKEIKVKTAYFFITLVLLMNFFLTLSRGPMLALIIGMLFYFILTNKRSKQIIFLLAITFSGVLLIGIIAGAVPSFVKNFLLSLLDSILMRNSVSGFGDNANASLYRLYLFDLAKKLVSDNYIWLGRGLSFFRMNEVYDWVPGISNTREIRIVSVDNYYILKYIEMGLTGIISTLIFIFSLIYLCIVNFTKTENKEFMLCFLFIFISYFISLFTVDEIGTFKFIWIITGMVTAKMSLNQVVK